jgi:hypothetical protein
LSSGILTFSGEPVSTVPFKALTDHTETGDSLDEFLDQYPNASLELAIALLGEAELSLAASIK